jgi:hypothetical protein
MEKAPRNTHERVYIDMSSFVMYFKKKCFVVAGI